MCLRETREWEGRFVQKLSCNTHVNVKFKLSCTINSKETSHLPPWAIVSKLAALSSLNEHMYCIVRVAYQSKFAKVKLCSTIQTKVHR